MPRGTIQKRIDAERKEFKKETRDFDYDILNINFDVNNMLTTLSIELAEGAYTIRSLSYITHIKLLEHPSAIKNIDKFIKNSEKYLEKNFITQTNLNALKIQNNKLRVYKIPELKISSTNRKDITNHKEVFAHMHKNLKPILERIEEILENHARVPKRSRSKSKSKSRSRSNKRQKTEYVAIGGGWGLFGKKTKKRANKKRNKTKKRRR